MPQVSQSTDQQIPAKEAPKNIPHKINWLHVLIGVVIGVVLLGAGFGVYFLTQSKSETTNEPIKVSTPSAKQATPSATATPSANKDETSGWKAYSNSDVGFSLKYPSDWLANKKCEETVVFFAPTQETLGICNSGTSGLIDVALIDANFKSYVGQVSKDSYDDFKEEETKIGGKEAVKRSGTFNGRNGTPKGAQRVEYLINHNSKVLAISYTRLDGWIDYLNDFETIVQTFKFLD